MTSLQLATIKFLLINCMVQHDFLVIKRINPFIVTSVKLVMFFALMPLYLDFYILDLHVYSIHEYHQIRYDKPHRLGAIIIPAIEIYCISQFNSSGKFPIQKIEITINKV